MTTPTTVNVRLQLRADTAANWTAANPTLLANEVGLETDTKKLKVGNGSTAWNSLAYFPSIVSGGTVLGNLEIGSTGTLTFEGSTADGFETTLAVTNPTADRTITLPNQSGTVVVSGNASIVDADIAANAEIAVSKLADGAARQLLQTDAAGTGVEWTSNVDIPGTLDVTSTATFDGDVTVAGNLTVNGTTTNINTQNLVVEDKNIILGDVATPTDVTADGGGITLKGATDKTINWVDATDAWTSSERFSVPLGSAASPSLTFTGDENTGIYSPGADQVAISTNGTGRLFVDASGRILVGPSSTSPTTAATLILQGSSAGSTAQSILRMSVGTLTPGASDSLATIVFADSSHTTAARISAFRDGGTWTSGVSQPTGLLFATTSDASATAVERLRITSAGLVGVGTSSPSPYQLYVNTTGAYSAVFQTNTDQSSNSAARRISLTAQNFRPTIQGELLSSGWVATDLLLNPSGGNVGIGTTSPSTPLEVSGTSAQIRVIDSAVDMRVLPLAGGQAGIFGTASNHSLVLWTNATERARIDSSGRLLVGTSSAPSVVAGYGSGDIQLVNQASVACIANVSTANSAFGAQILLAKSRGGTSTVVQNGDIYGQIRWAGADGTDIDSTAASIEAVVDGTPGANDMPGRLVFSTTADGASSPTERMRISQAGDLMVGRTSSQNGNTAISFENNDASRNVQWNHANNASFGNTVAVLSATRAANSGYRFLESVSSWTGTFDIEFNLRGDGNAFADGTWSGGGADYAEFFEWSDSNPDAEDRRGISVVLDGDKIREAQPGEDPIGVISGNPSVVGDAAWNKWSGKYLRDEFGTYIQEDYEVTDDDGNTVIQQRRKLNPAYDPDVEYISREQRPEWDCVGLMGKLRIRKGQVTGSRWIKMRDISDSVEEWLVR